VLASLPRVGCRVRQSRRASPQAHDVETSTRAANARRVRDGQLLGDGAAVREAEHVHALETDLVEHGGRDVGELPMEGAGTHRTSTNARRIETDDGAPAQRLERTAPSSRAAGEALSSSSGHRRPARGRELEPDPPRRRRVAPARVEARHARSSSVTTGCGLERWMLLVAGFAARGDLGAAFGADPTRPSRATTCRRSAWPRASSPGIDRALVVDQNLPWGSRVHNPGDVPDVLSTNLFGPENIWASCSPRPTARCGR